MFSSAALGTMYFIVCVIEREHAQSLLLFVMHAVDKMRQRAGQIREQQRNKKFSFILFFEANKESAI